MTIRGSLFISNLHQLRSGTFGNYNTNLINIFIVLYSLRIFNSFFYKPLSDRFLFLVVWWRIKLGCTQQKKNWPDYYRRCGHRPSIIFWGFFNSYFLVILGWGVKAMKIGKYKNWHFMLHIRIKFYDTCRNNKLKITFKGNLFTKISNLYNLEPHSWN